MCMDGFVDIFSTAVQIDGVWFVEMQEAVILFAAGMFVRVLGCAVAFAIFYGLMRLFAALVARFILNRKSSAAASDKEC